MVSIMKPVDETEEKVREEDTLGYRFEREFVRIVLTLLDRKGERNFTHLAERAFPYRQHPGRAFRRMRNSEGRGAPQPVRLSDAYNLALALGEDPASVFWMASRSLADKLDSEK